VLEVWAHDDEERHVAAGIDQEQVLAEIGAAQAELEQAWRPLADGFAALAGVSVGSRG
jgi:GMP synthase (glutamine-hydrolysing)